MTLILIFVEGWFMSKNKVNVHRSSVGSPIAGGSVPYIKLIYILTECLPALSTNT